VKHVQVKRLTYVASAGTLVSVALMSAALLFPGPFLLVVAMSVGQGIGILALSLFLLAIALDLNIGGALVDNVDEQLQAVKEDESHEK
jgi:hypothetical protein